MKFGFIYFTISFIFVFLFCFSTQSQVIIYEPPGLSVAINDYAELNQSRDKINGWSILITLNRDRRQMEKMELRFKYHYPEFQQFVSWTFEDPYYKLIVGAFPDRISSLPVLEEIRRKFPAAFEIKHSFPPKEIMDFRRASYYILQKNLNE